MWKHIRHVTYGIVAVLALNACASNSGCTSDDPDDWPDRDLLSVVTTFLALSRSSPSQVGFGAGLGVPLVDVGAGRFVALGSYEYSMFDGGHDNVYSLGVELRRPLKPEPMSSWVGANAIYHRWVCTGEDGGCDGNPAANGFGLNVVFVKPLADGGVRVWTSAGPKWLTDFKTDGELAFESGFGWHAKVGVEIPIRRGSN